MPTNIEWTNETWNPVHGCTKVSAGCLNCYAERMARRLAGRHGYPNISHHFDVTLRPDRLEEPLRWRKPRMIFVCSMGDLFHEDVPFSFVERVWDTMIKANQHTFQVLTKRPDRMQQFADRWPVDFVPPNIWLGVTAENQEMVDERVPILLDTPAAVRFVSVEPMLGQIDLFTKLITIQRVGARDWVHLNWVIVGAETGPAKRPMELDWARSVRNQCVAADVPFFFKKDSNGNRELDGQLWEQWPGGGG